MCLLDNSLDFFQFKIFLLILEAVTNFVSKKVLIRKQLFHDVNNSHLEVTLAHGLIFDQLLNEALFELLNQSIEAKFSLVLIFLFYLLSNFILFLLFFLFRVGGFVFIK